MRNWYADFAEGSLQCPPWSDVPGLVGKAIHGAAKPALVEEPDQDAVFRCQHRRADVRTLEGNYPCCTVNHPQGYPKFLSASFVTAGSDGLAHALLAPANVTTTLKNGAQITVIVSTNYPFDLDLTYTMKTTAPISFYVRVPGWADKSRTTTWLNTTASASTVSPDPVTGMHKVSIGSAGTFQLDYHLSTSIRVEPRPSGSVAVFYGAVLYGLSIASKESSTVPWDYRTNAPMVAGYAPPQARDWTIVNASAWNYAIDPSSLQYHYNGEAAPGKVLKNPIWAPKAPPNLITATACLINWPLYKGSIPDRIPAPERRKCLADPVTVELRPLWEHEAAYGRPSCHGSYRTNDGSE